MLDVIFLVAPVLKIDARILIAPNWIGALAMSAEGFTINARALKFDYVDNLSCSYLNRYIDSIEHLALIP